MNEQNSEFRIEVADSQPVAVVSTPVEEIDAVAHPAPPGNPCVKFSLLLIICKYFAAFNALLAHITHNVLKKFVIYGSKNEFTDEF